MPPRPIVSIVIVNYNSGQYLHTCIESIARSLTAPYEIVIVDNRSDDGSLDFLSSLDASVPIRLLRPGANLGFGAGCNLGALRARGEWLHFLNPDTTVTRDLDGEYGRLAAAAVEDVIFVTRLTDMSGNVVKSGFVLPTLKYYWWAVFSKKRSGYWYRGASVIMSQLTFRSLGGWATYTLAYAEDIDLFLRARRAGIRVVELAAPVAHAGEGCTQQFWDTMERRVRVERATREFYSRNGMLWQYYLVSALQISRKLILLRSDSLLQGKAVLGAWRLPPQNSEAERPAR